MTHPPIQAPPAVPTVPANTRPTIESWLPRFLCSLVFLSPFVFVRGLHDPGNLPQSSFIQWSALALLFLWTLAAPDRRFPSSPFDRPLALFLLWSGISLLWARRPHEGAVLWIHWGSCALLYWLLAHSLRDRRDAQRLLGWLALAGAGVSVLGLSQHFIEIDWFPQASPPAATFVNKNMAAQFVVTTLPLSLVWLSGTPARVWLAASVAGLHAWFLFLTFTRSAWLALIVECLLGTALALRVRSAIPARPRVWIPASIVALAVVCVVAYRSAPERLARAYDHAASAWRALRDASPAATQDPSGVNSSVLSAQSRLAIWRNTLAMVQEHPIRGVGLGNHAVHYPHYARRVVADPLMSDKLQLDYVHNDYLQTAAELGLVGLGLALWLAWTALGVMRLLFKAVEPDVGPVLLAVTLGLAGLLVDAFFSFPLERALPPLVAAVLLAVLARLHRFVTEMAARSPGRDAAPNRLWSWVPSVALVGLVAVTALHQRQLRSDWHCLRMFEAEARGDWTRVQNEAARAHRLNPHRKEPAFMLATAYLRTGQADQALPVLRRLADAYPYDVSILGNLGASYAALGDSSRAAEAYQRVVTLTPKDAGAHYSVGTLLERLGDRDGARRAYSLAAGHDPRNPRYHYKHGVLAFQARSLAEARSSLERAVALDPASSSAHKALGVLLFDVLGEKDRGASHLARALELDPQISDGPRIRELLAGHRSGRW